MLTTGQQNAIMTAVAALDCLSLFAAGKTPYAQRGDAEFDAKEQRDNLKRQFPELFAKKEG